MSVLEVYAGKMALQHIQQQGFNANDVDVMLGASGGPKWFVLAGLDRVMMPEFFKNRSKPLDLIGSSAGSFRFACYAQRDPLSAINRLAYEYSHTVYSAKPTNKEITRKAEALLNTMLAEKGVSEIVNNPVVNVHFVVARCLGLTRFDAKTLQLAGLLVSAIANKISRRTLSHFYQRFLFSNKNSRLQINDPANIPTSTVAITEDNLQQALMASGSIPIVLEGVKNINGAAKGVYRDGGIIDYHFDLKVNSANSAGPGLVLYPHFYSRAVPGWFDKNSKRQAHSSSFDNVLMLVPSAKFVNSLPYGKIPDRKDFETMPAKQRIAYWQQVLSESDRLGEAFIQLLQNDNIVKQVKPITFNV
ncbi:patatin-like phospholipase family protein [Alteromonadaceae bacterium BrNp21-10]|nr:patatin-like phospholipase family protein [Alteromonadaceae bacterium BrNp21-10]